MHVLLEPMFENLDNFVIKSCFHFMISLKALVYKSCLVESLSIIQKRQIDVFGSTLCCITAAPVPLLGTFIHARLLAIQGPPPVKRYLIQH
jgi:hypothetical protein